MADTAPYVAVLGTAQDAGFPAAGCDGPCCAKARAQPELRRFAACLAIVDPQSSERWIIDCTPDFREQLELLDRECSGVELSGENANISGILLTHAHIGHYLGLAHLGREGLDAQGLPVYAMPRMADYLRSNAPWSQLVSLGQIELRELAGGEQVALSDRVSVTPIAVPHRGEFSETVGFLVSGPRRAVFYLPDIDGWSGWSDGIARMIEQADVLFVDGTFHSGAELPGRDMSEIPHPSITDSMVFFAELPAVLRSRIRFIHFNHSNPVLHEGSEAAKLVRQAGFGLAQQGETVSL